jgi:hypothetical protein
VGAGRDVERAARVVRAYQLWGQRWDLRSIAVELEVSHETVRRYIAEYVEANEWREARARAGRVDRMSGFLNQLAAHTMEELLEPELDEDGAPVLKANGQPKRLRETKDVLPGLMKIVTEINRVEGNYAPLRTIAENDRRPPDPALVEALEQETRSVEAADDDEMRRELER